MSKRSECSIFLISESETVRADFGGKNAQRIIHFARAPRSSTDSIAEAMGQLLDQRKLGRRCFVFETSIWCQIVTVPQRSIEDILPNELQNALKFEVETLSGVDADNSALGIAKLANEDPAQASFWINVVNSEQFESVSEVAKSRGAKWVCLAHPAGFVADAIGSGRKSHTIEFWDNVAVLLHHKTPVNIIGRTGLWREQLHLDSETDLTPYLILSQSMEATGEGLESTPVNSLDDEEHLKSWLQCAARRGLSDSANSFPLVKTFEQVVTSSAPSITFYRVIAAAIVALFCVWHWNWLESNRKRTELEILELERPAIEKRSSDQQLAKILEQRSSLEQAANETQLKIKKIEFLLEFQSGRLGKLLDELKTLRTDDLVINKIELDEQGIVVSGLSLRSNSAPEFAKKLTTVVQPLGWDVDPATQTGKNQLKDGGPYEFSILLIDVGPGQPVIGSGTKPEKVSRTNPI